VTCSVFHTPFAEFAKCATPADWTFAILVGAGSIGPVIALCVRIARRRST
jgi:hypothetical protein